MATPLRGQGRRADVVTQTADRTDINTLFQNQSAATAFHYQRQDTIVAQISGRIFAPSEEVLRPGSVVAFERATEAGEPVATRIALETDLVGFPFYWNDAALRRSFLYIAEASAAQLNAEVNAVIGSDHDGQFRAVMGAIFTATSRLNREGVTVYGPWNGKDGAVPPTFDGQVFLPTETNQFTTASSVVAGADVTVLVNKVVGKGYGPSSGARVMLLVHPTDAPAFLRFRAGQGAADGDHDYVPSVGGPARYESTPVTGALAATDYNGLTVMGSYGPALVVTSDLMPRGYVVCVASYGPNSARNPVGFREHAQASLRGLILRGGPNTDYPLIDSFFIHGFGAGMRHRGGAAVLQITTATTYTAPTEYSAGTF